jgi:peroxiredoxin
VHAWGPQGDTTAVVGDRGRFALTLHRAGRHYLWVNTDRHRGQGRWTEVGPEADIRRWTVRLKRQQKGGPDSTFHARIQAAWDTVRKHRGQWEKRDSLQRRFAETFYRYYQTHPDTRTRWFALQSATMMWGNVGAVSKIDRLLGRMGPDSRAWPYVLIGLRGAYVHSRNERDRADYARLLRRSMDRVTPPEGQAALRTKLARHYQVTDSLQRAKALHEDVVALDAGSLRTAKAQANIREIERLNVGQKAPSFRAETVRGRTISLSDLDGQVVLLLFWNPSCDPCGPELTSLRRTWSKYKDEGFRVVSVVLEDDDSRFRNHVRKRKASWPLVRQAGMDAPIPRLYGVNRIADVYLIDRTGRIAAKHFGARQLGKKLRDLLPAGQGEDAEPVAARPAAARQ